MSYLIGTDEISVSRLEAYRKKAKAAGVARALELAVAPSEKELCVREAAPGTDLSQPAGAGYTNETYVTGAIVAAAWTSVFDTAVVPVLGNRQVAVFYKVFDLTAAPVVTAVRFRLGVGGASTLAWFPLECIVNAKLTPEAWFTEPVVYSPQESMFIECITRANSPGGAGLITGERLGFGCFIIEPLGSVLS